MPTGFGPVFTGAATVFFAVFGYDAMSTAAEEAEDGKKHMPKAIILSLVIAMTLYVAATLVLTGMQKYTDIDPNAGFASAFKSVGLSVIASIISVFAVLSILTVMLTFLLGVTRVWFSMSRDGLLPPWFAKVDSKGTPQRVTWIAGIGSAVLAGVFPIRAVADLTNIGILSAFIVVCVAVILFRYTRPDTPRTFRLPLMPVVPAFGVVSPRCSSSCSCPGRRGSASWSGSSSGWSSTCSTAASTPCSIPTARITRPSRLDSLAV